MRDKIPDPKTDRNRKTTRPADRGAPRRVGRPRSKDRRPFDPQIRWIQHALRRQGEQTQQILQIGIYLARGKKSDVHLKYGCKSFDAFTHKFFRFGEKQAQSYIDVGLGLKHLPFKGKRFSLEGLVVVNKAELPYQLILHGYGSDRSVDDLKAALACARGCASVKEGEAALRAALEVAPGEPERPQEPASPPNGAPADPKNDAPRQRKSVDLVRSLARQNKVLDATAQELEDGRLTHSGDVQGVIEGVTRLKATLDRLLNAATDRRQTPRNENDPGTGDTGPSGGQPGDGQNGGGQPGDGQNGGGQPGGGQPSQGSGGQPGDGPSGGQYGQGAGGQYGQGAGHDPEEDDVGDDVGPAFVPAPRPSRRSNYEELLAVPYSQYEALPTQLERSACALLVLQDRLDEVVADSNRALSLGEFVDGRLLLHIRRLAGDFMADALPLVPRLKAGAAAGKAFLEEQLQAGAGASVEDLWPIPPHEEGERVVMSWLAISTCDPVGTEGEPTSAARALWRVAGVLEASRKQIAAVLEHLDAGDLMATELFYQLDLLLTFGRQAALKARVAVAIGADRAEAQEQATSGTQAQRVELIEQAEERMVIFGASEPVRDFGKIGLLPDGRQAGVAMDRANSLIALGNVGQGKSHLSVLLIEAMLLAIFGLGSMRRRGVPFVFATDFRKGFTRHQHLCGLHPNPNLAQWQWLRQYFHLQIAPHAAAFKRIIVMVPPGTAPHYQAQYPDLLDRGLEVREIRLHPREWTSFGYKVMIGGADGKDRAQYQAFIENLVATQAEQADPLSVLEEFKESGLGGGSKRAMETILLLMNNLTSRGEHFGSLVEEQDALVVVLLESAWLGQDLILPLQMVLINALTRAAPSDLPLLFVLEELGKQAVSVVVQDFIKQLFTEVRHSLHSIFLGAQLGSDLPNGVIETATGIAQFGGCSPAQWKRLLTLRRQAHAVSYAELATMGKGVARLLFSEATDSRLVQVPPEVILRPSCVWAGGETRTIG